MTDIENYFYNGTMRQDAISNWTGFWCEVYLLPDALYIVHDETGHYRFDLHTLEACNTKSKLESLVQLDNFDDYEEIVTLVNTLLNKSNENKEVLDIVNGVQLLVQNEIHLPMQIKIKAHKVASLVLSVFAFIVFVIAAFSAKSWINNTNKADTLLFATLTILFAIIGITCLFAIYKVLNKAEKVNQSSNYGIWLTQKYLIVSDANEGIQFSPISFINKIKTYQSGRPPLNMVVIENKKGYNPLRLVSDWLVEPLSKEQLALLLEKQLLVLQLPATYILEINRLINYASTYSSKMFTLNSGLSTFITTNTTTTLQRKRMAEHIAYQIEEWPDDIKIIPEDWVFDLEIESNWEYGVNGVSYKEEWTGIKTYHWLMPIGKVFILEKTVLSPFFVSELDLNNIANILSQAPLQKMIVKIALPDYTKEKLKRILLSKENLAGLEIEFL